MIIDDYWRFSILDTSRLLSHTVNLQFNSHVDGSELFAGEVTVKEPLLLSVVSGRYFTDILTTTCGTVNIFREALADTLEEGGFTGWKKYPVVIHDRQGKEVPGYCGISITGTGGAIDRTRGQKVILPPFVSGGSFPRRILGLHLNKDWYDGSDLFSPEGTALIIVNEYVRNSLDTNPDLDLNFVSLNQTLI